MRATSATRARSCSTRSRRTSRSGGARRSACSCHTTRRPARRTGARSRSRSRRSSRPGSPVLTCRPTSTRTPLLPRVLRSRSRTGYTRAVRRSSRSACATGRSAHASVMRTPRRAARGTGSSSRERHHPEYSGRSVAIRERGGEGSPRVDVRHAGRARGRRRHHPPLDGRGRRALCHGAAVDRDRQRLARERAIRAALVRQTAPALVRDLSSGAGKVRARREGAHARGRGAKDDVAHRAAPASSRPSGRSAWVRGRTSSSSTRRA